MINFSKEVNSWLKNRRSSARTGSFMERSHLDLTFSRIRRLGLFAKPFARRVLTGGLTPMLAGYKITHRCNLKCVHCPYWKRSGLERDFRGVRDTLARLRGTGAVILIIEGGEPMLWRDGLYGIEDVIAEAHRHFPCVCMTTNGLIPFGHLDLNRVWVSLDGPELIHDGIRGEGVYSRVIGNLGGVPGGRGFVSLTISSLNYDHAGALIRSLRGMVEGVTVQFYYPYNGLPDPMFVDIERRARILDELVELKLAGYPVANSAASLRELKRVRWTCYDELLVNADPDGTIELGCYLKNRGPSECSRCGFTAHNEMSLAFRGNFESILAGLRIFF